MKCESLHYNHAKQILALFKGFIEEPATRDIIPCVCEIIGASNGERHKSIDEMADLSSRGVHIVVAIG